MWQSIERISGLPFPDHSPSGVEAELNGVSQTATSLALDFQQAGDQYDLLRATNHAAAREIEAGNLRETNRVLSETVGALQDENASLRIRVREQEAVESRQEDTERDLVARAKALEDALLEQQAKEGRLASENAKTSQALNESSSQNAVYQEKIRVLEDKLVALKADSLDRETKAVAAAHAEADNKMSLLQAEAKQNAAVLETKLQSVGDQLKHAEKRERQASVEAQEARQEASDVHQRMHDTVSSVRREMATAHRAELDHARKDASKLKQDLESARQELQQATQDATMQSEESANALNEARNQAKDLASEMEGKAEQCDQLQTELDQTQKANEQLAADVASLEATIQKLQVAKDESDESLQSLKAALEDERHRHATHIQGLESNIMELFKQPIK